MSDNHESYIPASQKLPELTLSPLIMGSILGIVFGASSLYLALKVGMTVSASIPVAVLSITLFKWFSKMFGIKPANILQNNITQTVGSAGESIAFGVAVTMPALLILGFEMQLTQIMVVAILGGLLGILMMIPLRHSLVVDGHHELKFPEGTACAHVLIAGEKGGTSAKTVFLGFGIGFFYKFCNLGLKLWEEAPTKAFNFFRGAFVSAEVSPELLGVGYIIGPRIAAITVAGGILSSWVLIPVIYLFGDHITGPVFPGTIPISQMSSHQIWKSYVLYIGAGAVAVAGIMSMIQSMPVIIRSAKAGISGLAATGAKSSKRTDQDISMKFVLGGAIILVIAIGMIPSLHMNFLGALLIVAFGFLFTTVSSRITGQIGSSSNPISGMTVATLLITSLIFLALGWMSPTDRVTALCIAAIVCVAASNGGTTAQDLKTGYIVGGTPKYQQIGILVGALTSAIVIGYVLTLLNDASTIYSKKAVPTGVVYNNHKNLTETETVQASEHQDSAIYKVLRITEQEKTGPLSALAPGKYLVNAEGVVTYLVDPGVNGVLNKRDNGVTVQKYEAPKARLMSLIIDGILTQKLPWALVLLGAAIAIVMQLCGVPALAFAVGVYLPLSTSMPIFIGGMIKYLVDRAVSKKKKAVEEDDSGPGILYSSGLIAGGSIGGIALALSAVKGDFATKIDLSSRFPAMATSALFAVAIFAVLAYSLYSIGKKKVKA
jgi:putative OPT family oligopeptide transporter